jgi:hypothetical protein
MSKTKILYIIHAEYQGKEAVFDLDGNILEGEMPKKQTKLIEAWIEIHGEDLQANWKLLQSGMDSFRISPLQ